MAKNKRPPMKEMPKAKKGTFKRLLKYIWADYKWQTIVIAISVLMVSASMLAASIYLQKIIDACLTPCLPADSGIAGAMGYSWADVKGDFFKIGGEMAIIMVLGIIAAFFRTYTMATVVQGTLYKMRKNMFNKMESLPIRYFDTHQHGHIMSTYTNDTDAVRQLIDESIPTLFNSVFTFIAVFVVMLYYSVYLTLLVIGIIIVMLLIVGKIGGASGKYMASQQKSLANEEGYVEEMINGQKVVKVFNHEDEAKKKFDELNNQLYNDGYKAHKYGNILMPIMGNMGNIMYVALAFLGGVMVLSNAQNVGLTGVSALTVGVIVSYLNLSRQMSQTVSNTASQITMITMGLAGASRVFELMDENPEEDEGYVMLVNAKKDENGVISESEERTGLWAWKHYHKADDSVSFVELKGDIELDNVDFGYVEGKQVLYDVTLRATPGQKFAFVGATGAGKTTITNLINRFYDIQDGKIRYDGINVTKINKKDLRRSLGVVLQDVNLFTGTVMDNIRYGRLDATDDECIEAAKLANAHDFITRLPEGYNTMLKGNGSNLSQGQRQLLSIARAAVADPPAMILDEATSSIDTRTEALVQEGMDNLMKGRTVFIIAHRLSTIRNSDSIIVLDHGHIIERGTHDELLAQKGTYYELYTGATELE